MNVPFFFRSAGVIKTPMHAPETHSSLAGLHPLGRMGEVREIVEAVLYLESATFVTGETLHIDGGARRPLVTPDAAKTQIWSQKVEIRCASSLVAAPTIG
jgi:hypothetical protein